jgi:hypothetical protein
MEEKRNGPGRRKYPVSDGTCMFHQGHDDCFERVKLDIKVIEVLQQDLEHRLSSIEPTVKHNREEIDSMRKLQLATLVTGIISVLGIAGALALTIANHLMIP